MSRNQFTPSPPLQIFTTHVGRKPLSIALDLLCRGSQTEILRSTPPDVYRPQSNMLCDSNRFDKFYDCFSQTAR